MIAHPATQSHRWLPFCPRAGTTLPTSGKGRWALAAVSVVSSATDDGLGVSVPPMSSHTYRVTEIVGTSQESIDDAIRSGVTRASAKLRSLDWFEVTEIRGHLTDGVIEHYQVGLKLGFRLED
jgi:flavin-binding protein dodecin